MPRKEREGRDSRLKDASEKVPKITLHWGMARRSVWLSQKESARGGQRSTTGYTNRTQITTTVLLTVVRGAILAGLTLGRCSRFVVLSELTHVFAVQ